MAKRYRNDIEDIAEKMSRLRYKDMMALAEYFNAIEIDGSETPADWANFFHDWASQIEENYQSEEQ